jgi:hypothetical protein
LFGGFIYSIYFCCMKRDVEEKDYIHKFAKNLFWDVDVYHLSMEKNAMFIIQRVLEYGQLNDWILINKYYGIDKIVRECKQMRSINPVCLSFICAISKTKKEDYRCYHFKQSFQTLWNS